MSRNPERRRERRHGGPPRQALYGSFGVHGALAVLVFLGNAALRPVRMPRAVRVNMVAAAPEDAPIRLDPTPPEIAEEEYRPPTPDPTPDLVLQVETPTVEAEAPVEREPEPEPARPRRSGKRSGASGSPATPRPTPSTSRTSSARSSVTGGRRRGPATCGRRSTSSFTATAG